MRLDYVQWMEFVVHLHINSAWHSQDVNSGVCLFPAYLSLFILLCGDSAPAARFCMDDLIPPPPAGPHKEVFAAWLHTKSLTGNLPPALLAWPFDRVWHGAISFNKLPQVHLVPAVFQVCMCGQWGGGSGGHLGSGSSPFWVHLSASWPSVSLALMHQGQTPNLPLSSAAWTAPSPLLTVLAWLPPCCEETAFSTHRKRLVSP